MNHMTELEATIVDLTMQGMSARKVKAKIGTDLTTDQVSSIARKHIGKTVRKRSSVYNSLDNMRPLVEHCLARLGKDPYTCEICNDPQTVKCDIHHTKYEGATIYDLQYVCRSCNLSRVNQGLT